ncbi:MAG: SurA N-terminal domain-containing protein [Bacteroidales bacterium]|nr:SurA N-terminal domain-containing protein [Bacteroidales bacterium]
MAVLQKFRDKAGLAISIIIALALLSFIIDPSTVETAMNSMSDKYDIGKIAGKTISQQDFQEEVDKITNLYGNNANSEEGQRQIRNEAWQNLMTRFLFIKTAKAAGITVSEAELQDLISGSNPSPLIAQYFSDENGFNRKNLETFISVVNADPNGQYRNFWNYIQNSVYNQQYIQKYGALFVSSAMPNALMTEKIVKENNTTANFEYVEKWYSPVKDSTITVSAAEIKEYYNAHKKNFKRIENRDIEFVLFEVVPSAADIDANKSDFSKAYEQFAQADNISAFCLNNSEESFKDVWYTKKELSRIDSRIADFAFSTESGVSEIFEKGNTLTAARIMASASKSDSAFVKLLVVSAEDKNLSDSLVNELRNGADITALAQEHSLDKSSADEAQWLTRNQVPAEFSPIFDAAAGEVVTLNLPDANYIVELEKKNAPSLMKKVAILQKTAFASKETYNEYYSKASEFAAEAGKEIEGFDNACEKLAVAAQKMNSVTEGTSDFGGVSSAKEITRWVFDAKQGKVSDIITVNQNNFFVVALSKINKEGFIPVEEVSSRIESILYNDKQMDFEKEQAAAKTEGKTDLAQIAEIFNTNVISKEAYTLSPVSNQEFEPALAGVVYTAPQGKVVGPVKGQSGILYVKVNSLESGSFFTEEDLKEQESRKAQMLSNYIQPVLADHYEVVDNRERFY